MASQVKAQAVSTSMLTACGAWLVVLGLYFIFLRPPLLPEDLRFMGVAGDQVRSNTPGLEVWFQRVFIVMGGFIKGCGVLTVYVARVAMPLRLRLRSTC
nr:hypothetical protein [Rhodoferax sp.]